MDGKATAGQVAAVDRYMGAIWGAIDALDALEVESAWAVRQLGQEPEVLRIRRGQARDALCGIGVGAPDAPARALAVAG
jgi:hypothetical protein